MASAWPIQARMYRGVSEARHLAGVDTEAPSRTVIGGNAGIPSLNMTMCLG
jgi:hypothetical protein